MKIHSINFMLEFSLDKPHKDISMEKPNRQRFSTCSDEDSLQDQRRSKSFDEDTILGKVINVHLNDFVL